MKRSLRRRIERASNETWNPRRPGGDWRGRVSVVVSFPEGAFAGAPEWSPGPGFEVTAGGGGDYAWLRRNGDGTSSAVVAGVGPKEIPALDGGPWIDDPEVWTVTAPSSCWFFESGDLWDKPHRISRLLDEPGAQVDRELYASHPVARAYAYWEDFEQRWGFRPGRMHRGRHPFADHRRFVVLDAEPGWENLANEVELLEATMMLVRAFGGRPRVYGYGNEHRRTRGPLGSALTDSTLDSLVRRHGLKAR